MSNYAPILVAATGASGDHDALAVAAQIAARHGAKLLVARAFGRSRLREWVLGGAMYNLLRAENGPHLLLAH